VTRAAALRGADTADRLRAIADMGAEGIDPIAEELDALVDCLGDARKVVQRRAAEACVGLLRRDVGLGGRLRAALGSCDARVRWGAAYTLGLADEFSEATLDILAEGLGGDDGDIRWAALDLLKRSAAGAHESVVARLAALAAHGTAQQRKMALYGLRDLGVSDPAIAEATERALNATEADVRLAAISILARQPGDPRRAAAFLVELLGDRDRAIARAAAAALGAVGERSAAVMAALERARSGTDPALRRAAERSLRLLSREED